MLEAALNNRGGRCSGRSKRAARTSDDDIERGRRAPQLTFEVLAALVCRASWAVVPPRRASAGASTIDGARCPAAARARPSRPRRRTRARVARTAVLRPPGRRTASRSSPRHVPRRRLEVRARMPTCSQEQPLEPPALARPLTQAARATRRRQRERGAAQQVPGSLSAVLRDRDRVSARPSRPLAAPQPGRRAAPHPRPALAPLALARLHAPTRRHRHAHLARAGLVRPSKSSSALASSRAPSARAPCGRSASGCRRRRRLPRTSRPRSHQCGSQHDVRVGVYDRVST